MCSVSFERDRKRPVRVDNEAKACLDDIALELNRQTDAVLVVVGKHDPQEMPEAAAERTLNVKQYMTDEKGIDPRRIEVRTGENTSRTVDNILVPPGATWDAGGTTSFDPSRVQRHGEPYAPGPR
jgi:Icc-related predicted phosphoesterase